MKPTKQTGDTALTAYTAYSTQALFPAPEQLDDAAFHGLVGDFVRLVSPHTEADPVALLSQLLAGFGNLVGRGPHFVAEADQHFPNLFIALVGASSKGRKGSSWGHVQRLLRAIDEEWAKERQQSGLSSGEGLIWAVRDPITNWSRGEEVTRDAGVDDKRLLALESELASVLRVLGREGNTLSALIRRAWDLGNLRSLTKNSPATATDTHVSIIGHVTRDELRRHLDRTEMANGFANRFLWLFVRRARVLPEGGNLQIDDLAPLIRDLKSVTERVRKKGVYELRRDSASRDLWRAVYPELSEGRPGLLGAVISRAEAMVMRLALVYAVLDGSDSISELHLRAALALWDYSEASARHIFGDSTGDPVADEILRALRMNPEGLTRSQIRDLLGRNRRSAEIDRALRVLLDHRLAHSKVEGTGGRPAERWFAVSGYAVYDLNAERGRDEGAYRVNGVYRVSPERDLDPRPDEMRPPDDTDPSSGTAPDSDDAESPMARSAKCYACGGTRFWVSTQGDSTCGNCHPPAVPDLVDHWTGNPESQP